MHPVLLRLGPITVYSYTVLLNLGLVCGLAVACWKGQRRSLKLATVVDAAFYTVMAGLVGARLHYVLLNWAYFSAHPKEAFRIWKGGLAFQGAFVGGMLALLAYAILNGRSFWSLADVAALGLALGGVLGWLGCLTSGCAYGLEGKGFLTYNLPDIYGVSAPRFATQVVGSVWSLLIFALLLLIGRKTLKPGLVFLVYVLLYFGGEFFLEFSRGHETLYVGAWRVGQVIDLIVIVLAVALKIVLKSRLAQYSSPMNEGD
jgi:phosphatidylglycerol:prolipoprotein diacylglycerol transferase